MTDFKLNGHPTNMLYVLVSDKLSSALMDAIEAKLKDWPKERQWTIHSPELIDYIDEDPSSNHESHTFGFALRLYSAHPPWGEKLPKKIDRQHLDEVEYLLSELELLSARFDCSFKLQLDQIAMGVVVKGKMDERLRIGLINEWRKAHGLTLA
jgi:hypothetical protein